MTQTPCVLTLKDLMSAAVLKDMKEMVKTAQVRVKLKFTDKVLASLSNQYIHQINQHLNITTDSEVLQRGQSKDSRPSLVDIRKRKMSSYSCFAFFQPEKKHDICLNIFQRVFVPYLFSFRID